MNSILTNAIAMAKLERFRVKSADQLKAGSYIRIYVNLEGYGSGSAFNLVGKPMSRRQYYRKNPSKSIDMIAGNYYGDNLLSKEMVIKAVSESSLFNRGAGYSTYRFTAKAYVDDLIRSAELYHFNSKTEAFANEWVNMGDKRQILDLKRKITGQRQTLEESLDY